MRGDDPRHDGMFSYITPEARVRPDHPLRPIRRMTDAALARLSARFDRMYSTTGRPSIPPEKLLRALLLQMLYSIRSERLLVEELDGVRLDGMKPGVVREVSPSIGAWLIAERYAEPEMRRDVRAHEEDFLVERDIACDRSSRVLKK